MEDTQTNATDFSGQEERSSELTRPVQGRMLAGVSQGLADQFDIHPWIPRVVFIVTTFMGGLGIVLYAAGWVFIRSEDESESIADRFMRGEASARSWVGIALIVIAAIIILSNITFLAGEVVWAGAFLVVGLLLYLGYIPTAAKRPSDESSESKEGVQRMTPTEPLDQEIGEDDQEIGEESSSDSPAGGATPPPPVPTPPSPGLPPAKPRETSILGRLTIGVMLLGLGVLAILDNIEGLAIDAEPRHYLALAVAILGVGLLVGSVAGRARWLILVGVLLIPPLLFSPVFGESWRTTEYATPTEFTEVESNYHIDVGEMVIDLRELPWDGEEISLRASINAGKLEIIVPPEVGIDASASVNVGQVSTPGRSTSGFGNRRLVWSESGESGTVQLDAHVSAGVVEINR